MAASGTKVFRAPILHFTDDPECCAGSAHQYFPDGVLVVSDGLVEAVGSADAMAARGLDLEQCHHFPDHLLMPGLIDTHIHYPQTAVMGSFGEQLIDWLNKHTFPSEMRFADAEYAAEAAESFLDLLLECGTTTAMVYTTSFPQSTDAFFASALARNLRMIAGKVMMDRNAPPGLTDTVERGFEESKTLIEKWHGQGRLHYAVTPRFAPTSSRAQLASAGRLYREYDGVYLQTHLSENQAELAWVAKLFPESRDYLDVYDSFGLLGPRSVLGHGIHLCRRELERLGETQSRVAFCPTSNLFLGSGLFDREAVKTAGSGVGIATDVGGGTSFSMLQTLNEAYKVLQLQGQNLDAFTAFYSATLGNARVLSLDDRIGNLEPGKEADFILLDLVATGVQKQRQSLARDLHEMLFALMILGDERNVARTYVKGDLAHSKHSITGETDAWKH